MRCGALHFHQTAAGQPPAARTAPRCSGGHAAGRGVEAGALHTLCQRIDAMRREVEGSGGGGGVGLRGLCSQRFVRVLHSCRAAGL